MTIVHQSTFPMALHEKKMLDLVRDSISLIMLPLRYGLVLTNIILITALVTRFTPE